MKDIQLLEEDVKLMQSSSEFQKIPYLIEAIDHCTKELSKINNPNSGKDDEDEDSYNFEDKKRMHNKRQTLKKEASVVEELLENS